MAKKVNNFTPNSWTRKETEKGIILSFSASTTYRISQQFAHLIIEVAQGVELNLIEVKNQTNGVNQLDIHIAQDAIVNHSIVLLDQLPTSNTQLVVEVQENGQYQGTYLDLADNSSDMSCAVTLLGEQAKGNFDGSVMTSNSGCKNLKVQITNQASNSQGLINIYGIATGNSNLTFNGIGQIIKGAKQAVAKQKCTMLVVDEKSHVAAHPILLIDENDVTASHANSVGTIADDLMFYLCSRGLTPQMVKQMMMKSYIKPILDKLNDKDVLQLVENAIERQELIHD